jgi:hypothetical protein
LALDLCIGRIGEKVETSIRTSGGDPVFPEQSRGLDWAGVEEPGVSRSSIIPDPARDLKLEYRR